MKGETGMNRNAKGPRKHDVNEGRQGRGRKRTATGAPNVRAGRRAEQRRSGFVPEEFPQRITRRHASKRHEIALNCAGLQSITVSRKIKFSSCLERGRRS